MGREHPEVIRTLDLLASTYFLKGVYETAIALYTRAIAGKEKGVGADAPSLADSLERVAYLYEKKSEYERAEAAYQRALAIREKAAAGKESLDLIYALNGLASVYSQKRDYTRAESSYRRILAIREKLQGAKHPDVALTLNSLAWMYDEQGDYGKVEPLFQRALTIREEALGREHPDVASSLNILAGIYKDRGDYGRAEPLYQRALAIREKALGTDHPDVADTLDDLAWIYFVRQDYRRAEQLSKRALKIVENKLGSDHPNITSVLNQLALIYKGQGDFDKAEPLYQRALKIDEKAYGSDHPFITQSLHNLALLYIAKRDFTKAEALLLRSLAINEKDGPMSANLAEKLSSLAYFYAAKGDTPKAIAALIRGTEITERHIAVMLATATGTEEQKRALLAMRAISNETHGAVSLHVQLAPNDPQALRLAFTTLLRRKGRVLDAGSESLQRLRRRLNPEDQSLLQQLVQARSKLAEAVLRVPNQKEGAQYQAEATRLETEAQRLEAAVSARSAELQAAYQPATLEQIQKALPPDAALVEIVSYRPFNLHYKEDSNMWGAWRYAAYALLHEGTPAWIDLGEATTIEADVIKLRAALSDPRRGDVKELARVLDERVMRPVRRLLGETRQLLLSPDGALNLVPFGALVDERGQYLVENYSITYLTSGRDLLRLQARGASRQGPVVVADPLYDLESQDASQTVSGEDGTGGRRSEDFVRMKFSRLPGTAGEARALGALLPGARVLTETQATEAALKQVTGPSILHIATHGFFLADEKPQAHAGTRGLVLGGDDSAPATLRVENPLLRSGLALAGANRRQSAQGEDGVLTALEAAGLDLWGTKLVVLSACETGVGEVKNGDGVYGLRRALVLAGSESQVVSLWQVSDAATRDLMVAYYRRLQAGEGRTEALRQVQLEMIKSAPQSHAGEQQRGMPDTAGGQAKTENRSHPFYWASFIQSGEWRGLNAGTPK